MSFTILSGGVGGAKLVVGFDALLPPEQLNVIANTADDFEHLGLNISPDLDTLVYSLAGLANPATGWGIVDETFTAMESLERLGGATWFRLGDKDLATHLQRTTRLREGQSLTEVTQELCAALGVSLPLIPMSNDPVATRVHTDEGVLAFQEYFVKRQAEPVVSQLVFAGADTAKVAPAARDALSGQALQAVVLTPSNPYLSIDPILAVSGMRDLIKDAPAPVIAVSPIVGGKAIKGPTAKIMNELGLESSALAIAKHYHGLIDGLVIDTADAGLAEDIAALGITVCVADTVMTNIDSKKSLAAAVIEFAESLNATNG